MPVYRGKIIFCEGDKTSLDYPLLGRIVDNQVDNYTIVPAGGKFSFSNFIQGYLSGSKSANQQYLVFRDRDFDFEPTTKIQLLELTNSRGNLLVFLTHRACIENYLLDAELIHDYWEEMYKKKQESDSKWGHKDSPGVATISEWIETSAKNLQAYQAVRWALGDLVRMSAAREHLKTTWTDNSGELPNSLELQFCKSEALELINQFRGNVENIKPEIFEESLIKYQEKFDLEDFWKKEEYLTWFHGKDIQKEMQRQKNHYISLASFFKWAITKLDLDKHQDIKELQDKIKHL
ncbi:MAG: DUF4435 domain-containing protein [Symploca sp. SIO1B1]|nr:DUF4435 domain-containing protein [Symploca sp. SIO2D2]NER95424.1 DUF4435 domain-containing protein [Symploca sp. SIO1B1]